MTTLPIFFRSINLPKALFIYIIKIIIDKKIKTIEIKYTSSNVKTESTTGLIFPSL
jgi:hypothetical protein